MSKNQTQTISFYDAVADEYNSHMTDHDNIAREYVNKFFTQHVTEGNVMDFGGGTGLDLPWLLRQNYTVYFLEPSVNMSRVAKRNISHQNNLNFLDDNLNFNNWSGSQLPTSKKMNGVIANFAVLNCIENLEVFFEKISLVCEKNCRLVITVIDPRLYPLVKNYSIASAIRLFFSDKLVIRNQYKGAYQNTYIHSIHSIKKAADAYFTFQQFSVVEFSSFAVFLFSKK